MMILMICAGACELSMAQWASAYTESALGIAKNAGDILGPCLFAVAQGMSRTVYGKSDGKMDLKRFMLASGGLCLICYLLVAFSPIPAMGLIGCILCGFSVGIMWPGAIGPGLVGAISQNAGDNLKAGMLAGCIFPAVLIASILLMGRNYSAGTTALHRED